MKLLTVAALAACLAAPVFAQGVSVELTAPERTKIKEYVVKEKKATTKFAPSFSFSLGTALPTETTIYEIPDQPNYGYVVYENRPVLVEKRTRKIVEYID